MQKTTFLFIALIIALSNVFAQNSDCNCTVGYSTLTVDTLNGVYGFSINGMDELDRSGIKVSAAGDVNNDGIDDFIIGTANLIPSESKSVGESYVIYGGNNFANPFELNTLNGSNGFVIEGIDTDDTLNGIAVSAAGDVNNDGYDDVIIGNLFGDANGRTDVGQSYVIYGGANIDSPVKIIALDGDNGFTINGINYPDLSGRSVSTAGDVNNDGFDDLIIGANQADSDGISQNGASYVVYGGNNIGSEINLIELDGSNGFVIHGINDNDQSGRSVSTAGDINNDGFDDIIIGAPYVDKGEEYGIGQSYIIYGGTNMESPFKLSSLNGDNGIIINGIKKGDFAGSSVSSAGDVNNDGFDDVIIGANWADQNGVEEVGESYVVYGGNNINSPLNLSTLDGSNGFIVKGIDPGDYAGSSVSSAGDINNDGFDDIIIGADDASPNGVLEAGETYVIYGGSNITSPINLSKLNVSTGFIIKGVDIEDSFGGSVSTAGDINNDGFDDLLIGAYRADPNGKDFAGQSYIIYGACMPLSEPCETEILMESSSNILVDTLNGTYGFNIFGNSGGDRSGHSVSKLGDVNNDGYDDVIMGAYGASETGESYIVYGGKTMDSELNIGSIDGTNGFVIQGVNSSDQLGYSVSAAGDVNNDGIDDILVAAPNASPNGNVFAGESYVVYGQTNFTNPFELSALNGNNGFVMKGIDELYWTGRSVSAAGDVNNDGYDDLLIGAENASPNGKSSAGESYVVYGGDNVSNPLNLSALNGTNGFVIRGLDDYDNLGGSVSNAGDVNNDGFDDVIIGASLADPNGKTDAGESYVIFGGSDINSPFDLKTLNGSNGFKINGINASDESGSSVSKAGDINNDGFDDLIVGASLADPNEKTDAGESYIIYGGPNIESPINLKDLNGINGAKIIGVTMGDEVGFAVSTAGDYNNDGFDDVIIGAKSAIPGGQSYLIFGGDKISKQLDLSTLNEEVGFIIYGNSNDEQFGWSVNTAGDVNNDAYDDLIISSYPDSPFSFGPGGTSYVIYGACKPLQEPCNTVSAIENTFHHHLMHFQIYPNPANEVLYVSLQEKTSGILTIYNTVGQLVETTGIKQTDHKVIETKHMPMGNYHIILEDSNKKIFSSQKFVLIR